MDLTKYPKTEKFWIKDTIGVPHPYCITPRHVAVASDSHCGILDTSAIEDAEKRGAKCGICKGKLSYKEHETALLVAVKDNRNLNDPELKEELTVYLKSIVDMATKDHYAGFAFTKG
jgi:hypothetical protein